MRETVRLFWEWTRSKGTLVFFITVVVCLLVGVTGWAMAETNLVFSPENGEEIRDLCEGKSGEAYLLTSQRLLHLQAEADGKVDVEEIGDNGLALTTLCDTADGLFGISETNQFYERQASAWVRIGGLQAEYNGGGNSDATVYVQKTVALGNAVYAVLYDDTVQQTRCVVIQRGAKTCATLENLQPRSVCVWKDNTLLFDTLSADGESTFQVYNPALGTTAPYAVEGKPEECAALAYDVAGDTLYATTQAAIESSSAQGAFAQMASFRYAQGLVCFGSGAVLTWSGNRVYRCTAAGDAAEQALCVMGVSSRFDNGFTASSGISLNRYENAGMDVMQHMSEALASGDTTVDIYGFLTKDGLQTVKQKGMYTDLSQSAVLTEQIGRLYPSLATVLYDQNSIVAWPLDVQPLLRMLDEESLLRQYGIEAPSTFDELLDILPDVFDSGMITENNLRLFDTLNYTQKDLLNYLMRQYLFVQQKNGATLSFDQPVFRRLAQRILAEVPQKDPFPEATGEESALFILTAVSPAIQEGLLPPLKLSQDSAPAVETWMKVAVVNPFSRHKEQALRYLEYIATQKDENSYTYDASLTQPYPSSAMLDEIATLTKKLNAEKQREVEPTLEKQHTEAIAQLETQLKQDQEHQNLVTETAIENYHVLATMFVVSENSLIQYDNSLDSFTDQLLAGHLTLDGFIRACDQHIQMIYAENN